MKKHFNYFIILAALLMSAAVVSCEKEENTQQGKYTMTVYATKSVNNFSKALSLDGTGLHATWTKYDVVKVYKGDTEVGELTAESSGTSTKLSGSIDGDIEQGDDLKLKFLSPNYNLQDGTLTGNATSIDKVCDYAEADVTVASISGGNIRIEGASAEFVNKQSIVKFILKNSDGTATLGNPEYLQVSNNSGVDTVLLSNIPAATYSTNGAGIVFVAIPGFENKNVTVDAYLNGSCYSFTKNNITFADGKYYEIMVRMTYMNLVDLSKVKNNVTLQDGTTVIGTLAGKYKVSIENKVGGATVTLSGVNINGSGTWSTGNYAGLNCLGDATVILADGSTNNVKGFYRNYPGIHIPSGNTLAIQGTGTLNASSNSGENAGAGIGGGWQISCGNITIHSGTVTTTVGGSGGAGIGGGCYNASCGNIIISGGTITATGGEGAPGIGAGKNSSGGNITISGGTVTANGGSRGAGIGSGSQSHCNAITISGGTITASSASSGAGIGSGSSYASCGVINITGGTVEATGGTRAAGIGSGYISCSCGNINIESTVTKVKATKGQYATYSIGAGVDNSTCGTVTIGGVTGAISTSPYTYEPLPEGALSGKFTINGSGGKVRFSQGNLQATYDGSSWSWAFATNQWDYIGDAAGNTSINGNGTVSANNVTVDLFGWVGASSTWEGAAQYGISNSTATNNTDGYGNVTTEALKSDWGNTIGSGWRTLTSAEWLYVFNTRTSGSTVNGTSNARYTHATINTDGTGVNGMILFPDGVTIANSEATSWGTINGKSSWGTQCTSAEWTALAAKGCVFLPAAGFRNASVSNVGSLGLYWSSTPYNENNAYDVSFSSGSLGPEGNYRYYGFSVRLVRNAN